MDTSILHKRILEYKEKAKNPTSKEMILLFESWFTAIENHMGDMEIDYYMAQKKIASLEETMSMLCDIIILTGNADKVELVFSVDPDIKKAIVLLLKSKDIKNINNVVGISALLNIHSGIDFENIKQLKDHATRE